MVLEFFWPETSLNNHGIRVFLTRYLTPKKHDTQVFLARYLTNFSDFEWLLHSGFYFRGFKLK